MKHLDWQVDELNEEGIYIFYESRKYGGLYLELVRVCKEGDKYIVMVGGWGSDSQEIKGLGKKRKYFGPIAKSIFK